MKYAKTLLLLIICGFSYNSHAKTYTVGVERVHYYPLFDYEKDQLQGFTRTVLDAFANKSGHKLKYRILPIHRLVQDFVRGKLDFVFPDNPAWRLQAKKGLKVYYSVPVVRYVDGVIVAKQNEHMDLAKLKTLGTILGFTPWGYETMIKHNKIKLLTNASFHGLLKMVDIGRIDGAYINIDVGRYVLSQDSDFAGRLVFNKKLPFIEDHYYLSTIKYPAVIDQFDRFMKDNPELVQEIKTKYGIGLPLK